MRSFNFSLYVITDHRYLKERALAEVVDDALKGGASAVQLRNKEADTSLLIEQGLELLPVTKKHNASLIVNDRIDVALEIDADGVHLGQEDPSPEEARSILGMSKIIGVSVHNLSQAREALDYPVDYLGVGSVYQSESEGKEVIGLEGLKKICDGVSLPVVAIGGITVDRVGEVVKAGAYGIATISGIWDTDSVEERARDYVSAMAAAKRAR